MSTVTRFIQLPVAKISRIIQESMPIKRLFRRPIYPLDDYLNANGVQLGYFEQGDGYYSILALFLLSSSCGVNLVKNDKALSMMAESLDKRLGGFHCFFTWEDRDRFSSATVQSHIDMAKVREICLREELDPKLYSDEGTLLSAQEQLADIIRSIPDQHVVLMIAG